MSAGAIPTFEEFVKQPKVEGPSGGPPSFDDFVKHNGSVNLPESDNSISGRFLKTVTSDSPLNPANWGGMIRSAFESPFSDRNMAEAQHGADVFAHRVAPEPFNRGDIGEAAGQLVNAGLMYGAGRLLPVVAGVDPELNLAEGDIRTPSPASRLASAARAAGPDVGKGIAKVAGGAALDYAIPGEARIGALVGTAPLIRSGVRQIGRGLKTGASQFRGPVLGPELPPEVPPGPVAQPTAPLVSLEPSGIARIGITPAERIQALAHSNEGTVGQRAFMMDALRRADQAGASNSTKAAIIRRFERPEYTPRFADPRESEIIAPPPVRPGE